VRHGDAPVQISYVEQSPLAVLVALPFLVDEAKNRHIALSVG
jgi:hypothetical protein